jgi:hypothetical protein
MSYNPNNPNGQATMANSQPMAIASDQTVLPTSANSTVFTFSNVNSSTTNLGAGATFTGTIESIVSQQSYSVLFFADQNCTIVVKQFIDAAGTQLAQQLTFSYTASSQFARSGVMNGNYIQILVTNNGASPTTSLHLDAAFGTIPSATQSNNAPTSINEVNGSALSLGQTTAVNSLPFALASDQYNDLFLTGQSAQTATVNNILTTVAGANATDVVAYRSFAIQVVSTGTAGTYIFEGSNDNVNFQSIPVFNQANISAVPIVVSAITATASSVIYVGACIFRYIRLRIATTITGGSIQAFSTFSQAAFSGITQPTTSNAAANFLTTATTSGTAAHSAATSGNPVYIAGKVLPTTIATADATLVAGDVGGAPITTGNQLAIKPFGTSELDYNFNFSSVATTTTVQQLVPASGTASIRNYITSMIVNSDAIGAAGVYWILDSALTVSSIAITTGLVTTSASHDLKIGDAVVFTALAAGTGVSTNTVYYVTSVGSATTFNFAASIGGANVVPSVAYTGTTMYRILFQHKLQTTGIAAPVTITFSTPLKGIANTQCNLLFPSSLTSGNLYLSVNGYRGF